MTVIWTSPKYRVVKDRAGLHTQRWNVASARWIPARVVPGWAFAQMAQHLTSKQEARHAVPAQSTG